MLLLLAACSVGCPHINAGLPPHLRQQGILPDSPAAGFYHTVASGEDLSQIAKFYEVELQHLAEVNNLKPPYLVAERQKLFIPGVVRVIRSAPPARPPGPSTNGIKDFSGLLTWPVEGRIISEFGVREGVQHNGISIEAAEGTPVRSAADGRVGHIGSIPGLGNVVLLEHANRLVTVYAHLKAIQTRTGRQVRKGDIIATVGSSGRTDTPSLYFEVRSKSKPRNPLFFLTRKP